MSCEVCLCMLEISCALYMQHAACARCSAALACLDTHDPSACLLQLVHNLLPLARRSLPDMYVQIAKLAILKGPCAFANQEPPHASKGVGTLRCALTQLRHVQACAAGAQLVGQRCGPDHLGQPGRDCVRGRAGLCLGPGDRPPDVPAGGPCCRGLLCCRHPAGQVWALLA